MEKVTIKVLQRRMVIFSMLALLLTGGTVAAIAIIPLANRLSSAAEEQLIHVHAMTAQALGQHARALEGLALQVTSRSRIREALEEHQAGTMSAEALRAFTEPKLADAMQLSPLMTGIHRRTANGTIVASIGQPPPPGLGLPPASSSPTLIGPVLDSSGPGGPLPAIIVIAPILDPEARLIGSDIVVFSAGGLAPLLHKPGLHTCFLGRQGAQDMVWFTANNDVRLTVSDAPVPLISSPVLTVSHHEGRDAGGTPWLRVAGPQGHTAWQLTTIAPASDVFADVRAVVGLAAFATISALGLGALALLLLLRPLSGSLVVHADDMTAQVERLNIARRDLEEERRRLAESNADLEQFAYAASHDLQQPLRMISGFLDLLRRRYDARLDDQGREYIAYAINGASQLQGMIQGLLEYSRVGHEDPALPPIDLGAAARQARELLTVRVEETGATVTIHDLPTLPGDPRQIVRLFQNLIDNALKYHAPDRPPQVSITAERDGRRGVWAIQVADNGIGLSPGQQAQAFALFRRLHPDLSVEGTGLGLALCQKIAHRHGGAITLESREGEGSTFTITLPLATDPQTEPLPEAPAASVRVQDVHRVAGPA